MWDAKTIVQRNPGNPSDGKWPKRGLSDEAAGWEGLLTGKRGGQKHKGIVLRGRGGEGGEFYEIEKRCVQRKLKEQNARLIHSNLNKAICICRPANRTEMAHLDVIALLCCAHSLCSEINGNILILIRGSFDTRNDLLSSKHIMRLAWMCSGLFNQTCVLTW